MTQGLLLIGCGKMGGAMLSGWSARSERPDPIMVVEPNDEARAALSHNGGVELYADLAAVPNDRRPATVVLAVKPQVMDQALESGAARFVSDETVFLSIAAGKTVAYFQRKLGEAARIVRAMPNTPAAVGRGITVCFAGPDVDDRQAAGCDHLLTAVGEVDWVTDEGLIDAVTAVSGGGPAYVFLLMETLAQSGVAAGLPAELSARLAKVTVAGSGELARRSDQAPSQLRKNVTSPNGTTERALAVLMAEDGVQPLFDRAIAAATARSRELAD